MPKLGPPADFLLFLDEIPVSRPDLPPALQDREALATAQRPWAPGLHGPTARGARQRGVEELPKGLRRRRGGLGAQACWFTVGKGLYMNIHIYICMYIYIL